MSCFPEQAPAFFVASGYTKQGVKRENDKSVTFSKPFFAHNVDFAFFVHYPLCPARLLGYNLYDRKLGLAKVSIFAEKEFSN